MGAAESKSKKSGKNVRAASQEDYLILKLSAAAIINHIIFCCRTKVLFTIKIQYSSFEIVLGGDGKKG